MKKLLLIAFVFLILLSCTKSESNFLKEISGVWRAQQDGSMVTINHDNNKMMLAVGDNVIPVTVGAIDKDNKTVNLNVILATGKPGVWTLRQIWDKEHKTFHLVFTLHDGTQDDLTFVRTISTDDLNRFASTTSSGKSVNASASDATKEPPQAQAPPATPNQTSSIEQTGICKGLDLSITAEQVECLDRKYAAADKELNNIYKQTMSSLAESRKSALKKEQVTWIKEKESKCAKAGKEQEGGTLETVMIKDCFVQMTEQRVAYLKTFK